MTTTEARQLAAQAWCDRRNHNKPKDVELAEAFTEILWREVNRAARTKPIKPLDCCGRDGPTIPPFKPQ